MFSNAKPPQPVIRKVSVQKPAAQPDPSGNPRQSSKPSLLVNGHAQKRRSLPTSLQNQRSHSSSPNPNTLARRTSGLLKPRTESKKGSPAKRVVSNKRKLPSPSLTPNFDSSSSEGEDEADDAVTRKRARPSPRNGTLEPDLKRQLCDKVALEKEAVRDEIRWPIIQGVDLTRGKLGKEYKEVFLNYNRKEGGMVASAELSYPSRWGMERFQLLVPHEDDGYNPLEDVIQTVEHICKHYFPEPRSSELTDESSGFSRRLKRAVNEQSLSKFLSIVQEFNELIKFNLDNGTIPSFLESQHSLPLSLIERILSQVYSRTVSPQVNLLKQYENGTDDVYGELLPRFSHQIFLDTNLTSDKVFVDLGSGVGNVVLQAALQIGCESWGVERMPNPSGLAAKQTREFKSRCRRWAIKPGNATVLAGDFLQSPEIDAVLRRADVILVNNQAFTPQLNSSLTMKFLDLKEGCKVVSLRSFVPDNWSIKERNAHDPRNLLYPVVRKNYWSQSVSWTDQGGQYFVATKDSTRLKRFLEGRS